jgi:hypothetical protein
MKVDGNCPNFGRRKAMIFRPLWTKLFVKPVIGRILFVIPRSAHDPTAISSSPRLLLRPRLRWPDHFIRDRRQQAILIVVQVRLQHPRISLEMLEHSVFPL